MKARIAALALALGLGGCAGASGTVSVQNDMFFGGTDRHYTNGLFLATLGGPGEGPESVRRLAREALPDLTRGRQVLLGGAIGQEIYTPEDIERVVPDPADRPYAGWTFARFSLVAATPPTGASGDAETIDRFDLDLGVVGPASLAADTQQWWHETWGFREPRGWGRQLRNEPGLVASWERSLPARSVGAIDPGPLTGGLLGPLDLEVTPHLTASAGNVLTFAGAGATVRVGQNLPRLFGAPLLRSIGGTLPERGGAEPGWYLFVGAEARAVLRNLFLDGNTFRGGPGVEKRNLVGDLQFGAGLTWGSWRLTYAQVMRTREFAGQDFGDSFGTILLSFPLGPG
jgi:hypothetical protein